MNGKKWLKVFIVLSFLFVGSAGVLNYYIDSLGLVNKKGFLNKAAHDLLEKKYLIGLKNYNERLFNQKVILSMNSKVETLVLGSSRSMLIRHRNLPFLTDSFFNASVSNGIFGDILNLLFVYEKKFDELPRNIIINIDPWLFNMNNPERRYLETKEYYIQMLNKINIDTNSMKYSSKNNFSKIFSLEYLKTNLRFILNSYREGYKGYYVANKLDSVNLPIKEPDGSIHYPNESNSRTVNEIQLSSNKWIKNNISQFTKYNEIGNKDIFENMLKYLINNNVNVIISLSPFEPSVYNELIQKHPLIKESEKYIKSLPYGIKVIGSYSPYKYTKKSNDFTDYMHAKENIINKILKEIN